MINASNLIDGIFNEITRHKSIFEIPTIYSSEYFPELVKEKPDKYYQFLSDSQLGKRLNLVYSEVNDSQTLQNIKLLSRIRGLIDSINSSIASYYDGLTNKAYESFSNSLSKIVQFQNHVALSYIEPNENFYRIRPNVNGILTKRNEIFHIGFEFRHFCSTQRYSIPGLPSIYLGSTSYLCFRELGEPDITKSYISLFKSEKGIPVIDMQTIFSFIRDFGTLTKLKDKFESVLRYLLLFPVYLSSTIKVLNQSASFKTEYIIPQLLMQFISASNTKEYIIRGIKFPSTKLTYLDEDDHLHYSYVFPIVKSKAKGFCDYLSSVFNLTEPKLISDLIGKSTMAEPSIKYTSSDFEKIDRLLLAELFDSVSV